MKKLNRTIWIYLILMITVQVACLANTTNASGIRYVNKNIVNVYPIETDEHKWNIWYEIDGTTHSDNARVVTISNTRLIIVSKYNKETLTFNLEDINSIEILVDNKDGSFADLQEVSDLAVKLKYKYPIILNSSITIEGRETRRMIEELFLLKDFLLIQKQEEHIYIYPVHAVENWDYQDVDGTPIDIVRDFAYDINTKYPTLIQNWSSSDLDAVTIVNEACKIEDIFSPVVAGNLMTSIVTVYDNQRQKYYNSVAVFRKQDQRWSLIGWFSE